MASCDRLGAEGGSADQPGIESPQSNFHQADPALSSWGSWPLLGQPVKPVVMG